MRNTENARFGSIDPEFIAAYKQYKANRTTKEESSEGFSFWYQRKVD